MTIPPVQIKTLFITASGRNLKQLTEDAGFAQPQDLVNDALRKFKVCSDAIKAGKTVVTYNSETDTAVAENNLMLNPALDSTDILSLYFPPGHEEHFKAEFGTDDVASVLTSA